MKYNIKFYSVVLAVVLAITYGAFGLVSASETVQVIGECKIKAEASFPALMAVSATQVIQIGVTAYEDQTIYILAKDDAADQYMGQLDGFVHSCTTHGREALDGSKGVILINIGDPNVECILFPTD